MCTTHNPYTPLLPPSTKAPAFTKKKLTREERLQKNVDAKIAIYSNEAKRIKELIRVTVMTFMLYFRYIRPHNTPLRPMC